MHISTCIQLLVKLTELVHEGCADEYLPSPAVLWQATFGTKEYQEMSEREKADINKNVKDLASLWDNEPRMKAGQVLLNLFQKAEIPKRHAIAIGKVIARGWQDQGVMTPSQTVPTYDAVEGVFREVKDWDLNYYDGTGAYGAFEREWTYEDEIASYVGESEDHAFKTEIEE